MKRLHDQNLEEQKKNDPLIISTPKKQKASVPLITSSPKKLIKNVNEEYDLSWFAPVANSPEKPATITTPGDDLFGPLDGLPSHKGNKTSGNNRINGTFTLYTTETLKVLTELAWNEQKTLEKKYPNKKEKMTITLRYILTPGDKLFFAREGRPNSFIPPHFAMTGKGQHEALCITAGNIKIDATGNVTFISNKSGDFQPAPESLQYGLAALLASGVTFTNQFTIEKSSTNITSSTYNLHDVRQAINKNFPAEIQANYKKINAVLANQVYAYENSQPQTISETPAKLGSALDHPNRNRFRASLFGGIPQPSFDDATEQQEIKNVKKLFF